MSKIVFMEAIPIQLPFREKVSDAWGTYEASNHGIVLVRTDDGLEGTGEISFAWFGGAHGMCVELNAFWASRLIGRDITEMSAICAEMDELCAFSKRMLTAKAGVEFALWDILGKYTGLSVARLMGGRLRERIPLTGGVPMGNAGEMAEYAKKRAAEGYRELKLKIGTEGKGDLAKIARVRAVLPDDIRLRVDVNMAWKDRRSALFLMDALWDQGVGIVEQPLPENRIEDLAWLRERAKNRILIDEGVWTAGDELAHLRAGAADLLHLYPSESGGLEQTKRISNLAALYGISCTIGSMPEGLIGAAASAQSAACMENLAPDASDIRGFTVYGSDVAVGGPRIEAGELIIPDEPGLGVALDREKLAFFRSDK